MEAFGWADMELHARQNAKRKRHEEPDDCVPAKRPLTEEAMAAIMHQLNLSTATSLHSPPSPLTPTPLNITAVTTCPATMAEATYYPKEELMRGCTPSHGSQRSTRGSRAGCSHRLTPPRAAGSLWEPRPHRGGGSSITEGLDLACTAGGRLPQHPDIKVTPATPPSSEPSRSSSQDCEPMEQVSSTLSCSRLHSQQNKKWGVVLEDISSDSSDSEMSQLVWIAPELQTLATTQRSLLPTPILDEITKTGMAVVPWVKREQYLTSVINRAHASSPESGDSSSDSEEFQEDGKQWDHRMHSD